MTMPYDIDVKAILADLRAMGWADQKVEILLGFSSGYIDKLRNGPNQCKAFQNRARLFSFWEEESAKPVSAKPQRKGKQTKNR
jgi:hypothetical protein